MADSEDDVRRLELLGMLASAFGKELPADAARLMLKAVRDIPPEGFEWSVVELMKTSRFMPTVADIRLQWDRRPRVRMHQVSPGPINANSPEGRRLLWADDPEMLDEIERDEEEGRAP